jgi:tetratricopeptide (TPR) repeat protein
MRRLPGLLLLLLAGCTNNGLHKGASGDGEVDLIHVRQEAEASYAAKNYPEAEKHYTVLVQKVPVEADNWFRLGNIYARTNRPDNAIAAYREALVRDPQNRKAWFNMAILQFNSATNSLKELQKLAEPGDPLTQRGAEILRQLDALVKDGAAPGDGTATDATGE